jgi:hypothetical protein
MRLPSSRCRIFQAVLLLSSKLFSAFQLRNARLVFALATLLGPACLSFDALGQQIPKREIAFPTSIQWSKQTDVTTYRLQIAADEKFQNIFFDGRVAGERYVVSGLSPGYYYWRVGPADVQSGNFSKPVRFFVSGGVVRTVKLPKRARGARLLPALGPKVR